MANTSAIPNVFLQAASLMLPQLKPGDLRLKKVAKYAMKKYYNKTNNRICIICAIADSANSARRADAEFFKKLGVDPGNREVIVSDMDLKFAPDYGRMPEPVV